MKNYYGRINVLILAIGLLVVRTSESATVRVQALEKQEVQERQKAIGTLKAISKSNVAARESGTILSVLVNEGEFVKQGDFLVTMDKRRLQSQLSEIKASLATAKAVVSQREAEAGRARVDFEMKKDLYAEKAVSLREFLDAEREHKVAEALLLSSKEIIHEIDSRIEFMEVRIEDMMIKSPFDGWVIERHVEPGEWLTPGAPVVTIISSGMIEAWVNVPERLFSIIEDGTIDMDISVSSIDETLSSVSIKVIPQIDPRSRMFQVVAKLNNAKNMLKPGMSVEAWIPQGKNVNKFVVSADALIRNPFGSFVYKAAVNEEGHTAEQVAVKELFRMNGDIVIDSDLLKEGDLIIVEGNERMFPNTPVEISFKKRKQVN